MKYEVKIYENGVCIDHTALDDRESAQKIQNAITEITAKPPKQPERIPVLVCCVNASGESDAQIYTPRVHYTRYTNITGPQEEINYEPIFEEAYKAAREDGYDGPMIAFDENDLPNLEIAIKAFKRKIDDMSAVRIRTDGTIVGHPTSVTG